MKTPEEIKKGLECCTPGWVANHWKSCSSKCPYITLSASCRGQLVYDALAYIQQLEEKVPKWISVEERLPEKLNDNNQMYITEEVIGFDGECAYIGQYKVYKYDGHLTFFDGNYFRDDITHWMPMPEPPKEE